MATSIRASDAPEAARLVAGPRVERGLSPRPRSRVWSSLRAKRVVLLALAVLTLVIMCGAAAPLLAPYPPRAGTVVDSKLPPAWMPGGETRFALGTAELGRDILSRVIFGAQISLVVGF